MVIDTAPTDLQDRLDALAAKHDVPGAALGVIHLGKGVADDQLRTAACGVLNRDTGVEVTPDTIFQIGSITKVFTTTLLMQQVDEGNVDLDAPVSSVLPDLHLSTAEATETVTARHLLSHSSGIDGDIFTDHGRGDDCVEKYVAALKDAPQLFRPGTAFSYCNSGFVLAGRVLEAVTGKTWDQALRERIIEPLGLDRTSTLPEEAILGRAAIGHSGDHGKPRKAVDHWQLPRSVGPAGLINSTVADVLTFAATQLRDGDHGGDKPLLSPESARLMRTKQQGHPPGQSLDGYQGLGWMCDAWDGSTVFGHNGATVGQFAYVQAFPDQGVAVCLLTNGPGASNLWLELRQAIVADHGVTAPLSIVEPPEDVPTVALDRFVGRYGSFAEDLLVEQDGVSLKITVSDTEDGLDPDGDPEVLRLSAVSDTRFAYRQDGMLAWTPVSFGTFTGEQSEQGGDYLYAGSRLNRRKD